MSELTTEGAGGDTALLPCPFCGATPTFLEVDEVDSRRYMVMELVCCVTMRTSLGYNKFRSMTDAQIHAELKARLTRKWNTRTSEDDEA